MTAAALYSLLTQAYDEYKQTETLEEVLSFSDWCRTKTQASPQFHFWYMTIQLELLYLVFLRSLRTSCLPLYLDVLQKLTPWFFALDHVNYSRWVPAHTHDMLTLKKRLPQNYAHLLNGGFKVQKTAKVSSAIAIDHAHEKNNAMAKGDGEAVGLTENPAALRRWMISGPEVARLIAEFEASSGTEERMKPGSTKHHEEAKSTQLSFTKDVKDLISVIDEYQY